MLVSGQSGGGAGGSIDSEPSYKLKEIIVTQMMTMPLTLSLFGKKMHKGSSYR